MEGAVGKEGGGKRGKKAKDRRQVTLKQKLLEERHDNHSCVTRRGT